MNLQLLVDIGLFFVYVALFTLLLAWAWKFWMLYINTEYEKKLKYSLLEIKLPREINKSPEATEIFLKSVYDGGGLGTWYKENWEGRIPAVSSLEIVSLEGVIHFFIRAESKFKPRIEAAIYSQYPTVEIVEWAEDYTKRFPKIVHNGKEGYGFWGADWVFTKKGYTETGDDKENKVFKLEYSGDMYPIKTYRDWGLEKDPKEVYKHDPLTYVLETMGSIGKGEYFGYQILIRDAAKWNEIYTVTRDGKEEKKKVKIADLAKFEIEKYTKKWSLKKKGGTEEDEWGNPKGKMVKNADGSETFEAYKYAKDIVSSKPISAGDRNDTDKKSLELIQRKMNKPQVIAIFRTIYVAENGDNLGTRIPMLMAITRPFGEDTGFNGFRPDIGTIPDPFDYPWQNIRGRLVPWRKESLFNAYTGRGGFFSFVSGMSKSTKNFLDVSLFNQPSYVKKIYSIFHNIIKHPFKPVKNYSGGIILNLEELATLYHFPGEVAATPTLPRIDSVKSASPSNLPTE